MLDDIAPRLDASPAAPPVAKSAAGIPGGRVPVLGTGRCQDIGKLFAPLLLHIQGQGIGEELFKDLRGLLFGRIQLVEPVLFCNRKIELQALDLVHGPAALDGGCLHEVVEEDIEQHDDEDAQDRRYRCGRGENPQAEAFAREEGQSEKAG